jgi:hypothetical protein
LCIINLDVKPTIPLYKKGLPGDLKKNNGELSGVDATLKKLTIGNHMRLATALNWHNAMDITLITHLLLYLKNVSISDSGNFVSTKPA